MVARDRRYPNARGRNDRWAFRYARGGNLVCLLILLFWQGKQVRAKSAMSLAIAGQTNFFWMIFLVARPLGCESPCAMSNMRFRKLAARKDVFPV